MPVIFGKEVPTKTLWIGGGLIAAAVAVVVWLRARAASSAAATADQTAAQPDQGYQGAMSIPAASTSQADQYQQQLQNAQLQGQTLANQYQSNLIAQQSAQAQLQQQEAAAVAPSLEAAQSSYYQEQAHYQQDLLKSRVSCPGNQGVAIDPTTGAAYCRQKTGGTFLGIPYGDAFRAVEGFFSGAAAAAPQIGYNAANQAASVELGKYFPTTAQSKPIGGTPGVKAPVPQPSTPPIAPGPIQGEAIGYGGFGYT